MNYPRLNDAFKLFERKHESGKIMVAGTSCRKVSFTSFEREIALNHLEIAEKGITSALPDFNSHMFAVVKKIWYEKTSLSIVFNKTDFFITLFCQSKRDCSS